MTPNPAAWLSAAGSFPSRIAGQTGLPTYTTSYGYDLLNNLLSVSQTDPASSVTLSRSFAYDSLKRLVRATNPENGQIGYQYDAGGNLSSRADASRTVSYGAYDGMNRATSKSYSDGVTPAVTYTYGESILPAACLPEPGRWRLRPIDDGDRHSPERHHDCQQLFRLRSRGACEDE